MEKSNINLTIDTLRLRISPEEVLSFDRDNLFRDALQLGCDANRLYVFAGDGSFSGLFSYVGAGADMIFESVKLPFDLATCTDEVTAQIKEETLAMARSAGYDPDRAVLLDNTSKLKIYALRP